MKQLEIDQLTTPIECALVPSYTLTMPNGEHQTFASLGEVLFELNNYKGKKYSTYGASLPNMDVWSLTGESFELVQSGSSKGVKFQAWNTQHIFDRLIAEVEQFAAKPDGSKQPWEMTKAQWGAINALGSLAYGAIPGLSREQLRQQCFLPTGEAVSPDTYVERVFTKKFGYGHNGPPYDTWQTNARHEVQVAYALARGEDVPDHVKAEYRSDMENGEQLDPAFMETLLRVPSMCGCISAERLSIMIGVLKHDRNARLGQGVVVTSENAERLLECVKSAPPRACHAEIDDVLYEKGVLTPFVYNNPAPKSGLGKPRNDFAANLHSRMVEEQRKKSVEHIERERAALRISKREFEMQMRLVDQQAKELGFEWPNRIAEAIDNKNLRLLLDVLDGTSNETTKKAIQSFFKVKLCNVTAAQRKRAVYALVGFVTDEQFEAAKNRHEAEEAIRIAQLLNTREFEDAKNKAATVNYRYGGRVLSGAEWIETIVSEGFNVLGNIRIGAVVKSVLRNQSGDRYFRLSKSNGTADYAKCYLERKSV